MEEKNQGKKNSLTWVLVDLAFLVVIGVLMVNYINAGKENGKNAAYEKVNAVTNAMALNIKNATTIQAELSRAFKEYAIDMGYSMGDKSTVLYAKSIVENTLVEHVMLYDGKGTLRDETGKKQDGFDLSFISKAGETNYNISTKTPYGTGAYIVCSTKIGNDELILSLISIDEMAKKFKADIYEDVSFLALYDEAEDIAYPFAKFKDKDCAYLTMPKLLETISANSLSASDNNKFRSDSRNGIAGAVRVKIGEDSRVISATNFGINKWYLVMGVRSNYTQKMIENIVSPVRGAAYKLFAVTAIFSIFIVSTLIMMSARSQEKGRVLENKADTDLLTDLYNKAATERKIQEYIAANPNGRGLIFVLDIDNFKKINDTMGHAFGDTLLKTLGKEIRSEFRVTDIIGRTGGDEFMVFLKDVTDDVIVEREANRITRFFHDFKAGGDYVKYSATASIGAAIFPDDAKTFKDLYVAADQALYRAKKRGKNQLVFYNESEKRF